MKDPELLASFGYSGSALFTLDTPESVGYISGNGVRVYSSNSGAQGCVWGAGRGIDVAAFNQKRAVFAYAEKKARPDIHVLKWGDKSKIATLREGTEVEYSGLAFSRDGSLLVSLGALPDYTVTVWDWEKQTVLIRTSVASTPCRHISFNPRSPNDICLSGNEGNTSMSSNRLLCHSWSPRGDVLCGTSEGQIWRFDPATAEGDCIVHDASRKPINSIAVSKFHFVSASEDGTVRFFALTSGNLYRSVSLPTQQLVHTTFGYGYDRLFVGSADGSLFHLPLDGYTDPNRGEDALLPKEVPVKVMGDYHRAAITGMEHHPSKKIVATCGIDGTFRLWEYSSNKLLYKQTFASSELTGLAFSADGTLVALASANGFVRILNVENPASVKTLYKERISTAAITQLRFNKSGNQIAAVTSNQRVFLLQWNSGASAGAQIFGSVHIPGTLITDIQWGVSQKGEPRLFVSNDIAELYSLKAPSGAASINAETLDIPLESLQEYMWRLEYSICGFAFAPDRRLYVTSQDKMLRVYTLNPPKPYEGAKNEPLPVLFSDSEFEGHERAGRGIAVSPDGHTVVTVGRDGLVWARTTSDLRSSSVQRRHDPFVDAPKLFAFAGTTRAVFSPDSQMLFTSASDGNLFAFSMKTMAAIKQTFSVGKAEDSTTTRDVEDASELTFLDKKHSSKEGSEAEQFSHFKDRMRQDIERIRQQVQALIELNEEKPELERLSRSDFLIDTEYRDILLKQGDKRVEQVREQIKFENLAKQLLAYRIRKECSDSMQVPSTSIVSFQSNIEVRNYPARKLIPGQITGPLLDKIKFLKEVDNRDAKRRADRARLERAAAAADDHIADNPQNSGSGDDASSSANPAAAASSSVSSPDASQPSADGSINPPSADGGAASSSSSAPSNVRSSSADDEDDGSADSTNDVLYPPTELYTRQRKVTQMHILKGIIFEIKEEFNKAFFALLERKKVEIAKIEERNSRIRSILQELGVTEDLFIPHLADVEQPDKLFVVKDSEVQAEKFISPAERKRLEEQAKAEEERRQKEKGDDFGERALKMMMDGKLESRDDSAAEKVLIRPDALNKPKEEMNDEELKMLKEFEQKEAKLKEEMDKLRKVLEAEKKKLKGEIDELCKGFDDATAAMLQRKLDTDQITYEHELRIIKLAQAVLVEEEVQAREEQLQKELDELKMKKGKSTTQLDTFTRELQAFQLKYETLVRDDKELEKTFKTKFPDAEEFVDILFRLFRKRAAAKPRAHEGSSGAENSSDPFAEADANSHAASSSSAAAAASHYDDSTVILDRPEGLLVDAVWERFLELRRAKVESENEVRRQTAVLADMNKHAAIITAADEELRAQLDALMQEEREFSEVRLNETYDLDLLFKFRQGQVEVEQAPVVTDYGDGVLLNRAVIQDLNTVIKQHGKEKLGILHEIKEFRKGIHQLEWECERLEFESEELTNRSRDIQLMRVTKSMQEFVKSGGKGTTEAERAHLAKKLEHVDKNLETKVTEKKRIIRGFTKMVDEKKRENSSLVSKISELEALVVEREAIHSAQATGGKTKVAENRLKELRMTRQLTDLGKAQSKEIQFLRTELDRLRERTFPSFAVIQRRHMGNPDERN